MRRPGVDVVAERRAEREVEEAAQPADLALRVPDEVVVADEEDVVADVETPVEDELVADAPEEDGGGVGRHPLGVERPDEVTRGLREALRLPDVLPSGGDGTDRLEVGLAELGHL